MNRENLRKMALHIAKVPQEKFEMGDFRYGDKRTHECNSVGCIIGHCVVLDEWEKVPMLFGRIDFFSWSNKFTGIPQTLGEWDYLFSSEWNQSDNTPTGAAKRILHFIEHGLPENWRKVINGNAPLPYINQEIPNE